MSLWCFFLQVQLELRETTEQRDCLLVELQEKTAKLEEQIGRNSNLCIHFELQIGEFLKVAQFMRACQ